MEFTNAAESTNANTVSLPLSFLSSSTSIRPWVSCPAPCLAVPRTSWVLPSCSSSFSWLTLSWPTWCLELKSTISVLSKPACKNLENFANECRNTSNQCCFLLLFKMFYLFVCIDLPSFVSFWETLTSQKLKKLIQLLDLYTLQALSSSFSLFSW